MVWRSQRGCLSSAHIYYLAMLFFGLLDSCQWYVDFFASRIITPPECVLVNACMYIEAQTHSFDALPRFVSIILHFPAWLCSFGCGPGRRCMPGAPRIFQRKSRCKTELEGGMHLRGAGDDPGQPKGGRDKILVLFDIDGTLTGCWDAIRQKEF